MSDPIKKAAPMRKITSMVVRLRGGSLTSFISEFYCNVLIKLLSRGNLTSLDKKGIVMYYIPWRGTWIRVFEVRNGISLMLDS